MGPLPRGRDVSVLVGVWYPEAAFEDFLASAINFKPGTLEQAKRSLDNLLDRIVAQERVDPAFPRLLVGSLISGSLPRRTKMDPLNDIDVMVILDGTGLSCVQAGQATQETFGYSGRLDNPLLLPRYKADGTPYVSSIRVLNVLRDFLRESYGRSEITRDGQAVNVWLSSYGLGLDVVPTFRVVRPNGSDYFWIPVGSNNPNWQFTDPRNDATALDWVEQSTGPYVRFVIRLVKYWNRKRNFGRLRSYHLEVMCNRALTGAQILTYGEGVLRFFERAETLIASPCPTQHGYGGDLDTYLTPEQREWSLECLRRDREYARNAEHWTAGFDYESAIAGWRQVFGDDFPRYGL
jgi:hypothetical protein